MRTEIEAKAKPLIHRAGDTKVEEIFTIAKTSIESEIKKQIVKKEKSR